MEGALVANVGSVVFASVLVSAWMLPTSGAREPVVVSAMEAAASSAPAYLDARWELADLRLISARALPLARDAAPLEEPSQATAEVGPIGVTVLASWYGPGFYGRRTACGETYSTEIIGVAHPTLPCGTRITLTSPAGKVLVAPVIDRGPFVPGRTLDLSYATRVALSCSDLCRLGMVVDGT